MKQLLIGTTLLMVAPFVALAGERTVTLALEKMTCALCPITVTKAIKRVEGVTQVTVDYDTKRAIVQYDDDKTAWQTIAEASTNAGYPASKVE